MRVLITGGTGSLGHALVKAWHQQHDVRVLSRDELKQAHMAVKYPNVNYFLGDVRDVDRLKLAFYGCDAIVHAAALKRVDAVAGDPIEVVKTNVIGSWNVLRAALEARVPRVLLISTDKACEPINAYGASKFSAEQLFTAFNTFGVPQGTRASCVRYGNVLGSRGSVVHVWRGQDGPLTLTARGMTRFVITMPQAVQQVEQALEHMEGGEIFVPHLPACTLEDLAEAVRPGAEVEYVGLRPGGEKMHETLMTGEESRRCFIEPGSRYMILPHVHSWREKWWPYGWVKGQSAHTVKSDTALQLSPRQLTQLLTTVPEEGV